MTRQPSTSSPRAGRPGWPKAAEARLAALEAQIDDEVYRLYGISERIARPSRRSWRGAWRWNTKAAKAPVRGVDADAEQRRPKKSLAEGVIARSWPSVGFPTPSASSWVASAGHPRRARLRDLPPRRLRDRLAARAREAEFDELVGPPERFALVDGEGGRHLFEPEVEAGLQPWPSPTASRSWTKAIRATCRRWWSGRCG